MPKTKQQRKKEKNRDSLKYIVKFMFLGGAAGLLLIAVLRFTSNSGNPDFHTALLNFYFIFFGVVVMLTQLGF